MPSYYEAESRFTVREPAGAASVLAKMGVQDTQTLHSDVAGVGSYIISTLATTRPIIEDVIRKLQIRDARGDLVSPLRFNALSTSRPSLSVDEVPMTGLLRVRARAADPDEAAMIANTLAELFTSQNLQQRRQEFREARQYVEHQIKSVREDFVAALDEIRTFSERNQVVNVDDELQADLTRLNAILESKEELVREQEGLRAQTSVLRNQLAEMNPETIVNETTSSESYVGLLQQNVNRMELSLAGMLAEKTAAHPDVVALQRQIEKARQQVQELLPVLQSKSSALQSAERNRVSLEAQAAEVDKQIAEQMRKIGSYPAKSCMLAQLQARSSTAAGLFSNLLQSLNQIGIAESMTLSKIQVVEPATPPKAGAFAGPNRMPIRIVGAFLGIVCGLGLAFLVHYFDDTITSPEDVRRWGVTLLGIVPKFRAGRTLLLAEAHATGMLHEAYRTLRNSIQFASPDKPVKSLIVTSPLASEGKSTTAVNLAVSTARNQKSVVLVDADLRRPSLHKVLGMQNEAGLTSVLAGNAGLDDVLKDTAVEGLKVILSGPIPPDPGRLIESVAMANLLRSLALRFELVILDSPPVLAADDAVVLGKIVDGLVSVIECGRETRREFLHEREILARAGVAPLGAILNKYRTRRGGYYYYHYDSHGHGQAE
jgi:polysaccharide biosynthesis transport protein